MSPVDPGAQDSGLRRGRLHAAQAGELLERPLPWFRRQLRLVDQLAQFALFLQIEVAFAQFSLDDAQLFAQPDLVLTPFELIMYAAV